MNSARLAEVERGITGIARKVLAAVPVTVECNSRKIQRDMVSAGHNTELRTVEGCLCSLRDAGLVREPIRGSFIRIVAKPKVSEESQAAAATVVAALTDIALDMLAPAVDLAPAALAPVEALDKLAAMAHQVRKMAADAADMAAHATALAAQIDDIAVEFAERMQKATAEGAKFRQLQELLKGMD
jgi:hypothetical protein